MGLDINTYKYSYETLHVLRQWAHEQVAKAYNKYRCDNDTCGECLCCWLCRDDTFPADMKKIKFCQFLIHCDCEGGYVGGALMVKPEKEFEDLMWGNLDELKVELKELEKYKGLLDRYHQNAFNDFFKDVMENDDIVIFC